MSCVYCKARSPLLKFFMYYFFTQFSKNCFEQIFLLLSFPNSNIQTQKKWEQDVCINSKDPVCRVLIYRPPKQNCGCIAEFSEILSLITQHFDNTILLYMFVAHQIVIYIIIAEILLRGVQMKRE